jgi:preprotein translocase subunit SecF
MNFYIYNIICALFAIFIYISFRFGVDSYLRVNKNSKTFTDVYLTGPATFVFECDIEID